MSFAGLVGLGRIDVVRLGWIDVVRLGRIDIVRLGRIHVTGLPGRPVLPGRWGLSGRLVLPGLQDRAGQYFLSLGIAGRSSLHGLLHCRFVVDSIDGAGALTSIRIWRGISGHRHAAFISIMD
jgi:hypothetical protein